ncbi:ZIP family metal transporter [Halomarina oriensis]|uniref:ZIP family metal transporter n=1 Tax=Halomarina oriensis TaxID=671145 RepID=A0A6B0GGK7_9EURY|nr:ZIP family metal transporter [Halomarina oriensis]MWG33670.1 ZIP family metal transporter [Halomarina oriensis]
MGITETVDSNTGLGRPSWVGVTAVALLLGVTGLALSAGLWKVTVISWVAFVAMAVAIPLGVRAEGSVNARRLVWGYGLASGAMLTSAAAFIVPQAIGLHPKLGGFGIAAGVVVGFGGHTLGHRVSHLDLPFDSTAAQISAHALSAGLVIGLIYGSMPDVGLLLGLAIVSHKGPAGYASARRLVRSGRSPWVVLLPAAGVGIAAIPGAYVGLPSVTTLNAFVFGFAAGIFLHVALDFLPRCEVGSEVTEVAGITEHDHALLDRLRSHAVLSTTVGAVVVFGAWTALNGGF